MTPSARTSTAWSWRISAALISIAFLVKVVVLVQLWGHPLLQPHGELDTAYYITLGQQIATEGVLAQTGAFVVSPLYVYFLAAVFAAGGSTSAAQLIQIGLGAAAIAMSFAAARHWFGDRAALVAAGLAILTGIFTFNEILILQSAVDPFLVSCALYALTRATAAGGVWAFAAAGASLACLALNRPNALVFAVAAAAIVFVTEWRRKETESNGLAAPMWPARTWRAMALVTSLLVVLGANAARNYAVAGDAVLIASHGGLNLYIGNHDRADGTYTPVPGITPSIAGQAEDSKRVAEQSLGRSLSPGEVSAWFAWRAFDWVTKHPADALRLTLRKIAILLNHVDVPLNHSYAFYAREPSSFLRFLIVGPWLLLPLGLTGLFWPALRAHRRGYWVWAAFVPIYGAAVVLFFVSDRYRMPLFVPLCATAGAALVRIFELVRTRPIVSLLRPAGAAGMLSVLVFANLGLDNGISGEQTRRAVWLVEKGSVDEARRYVAQISDAHSHAGVLRFRVAQALLDAGRYEDAAVLLTEAFAIDGPQPAIRLALGEALLRSGRASEAVPHLEAAYGTGPDIAVTAPLLVRALVFAGRPDDAVRRLFDMPAAVASGAAAADVSLDFGTLALERGAAGEAIRWLRMAVERAPERAESHEKLGVALFLNGDPRGAVPYLERARRLDSASASVHLNLAAVYAQLGRFPEARSLAAEALRLDPAESRAAALLKAIPD